jgi:hypothetical protein
MLSSPLASTLMPAYGAEQALQPELRKPLELVLASQRPGMAIGGEET